MIKYHNTATSLLSSVSLFAVLLTAAPAVAQSSDQAFDDDVIIVTARKISESLQDIPVSIAAYSADSLDRRGIEDLTEIARATAGFAYEDFGGPFGAPTIRAQSQSRLTNPVQNVASFYNGVYLQRGYMIDQSLLNIGQVEILRGPQSASLGRNAFAGAITYTSKRASDEVEGSIDLGVGEDGYKSAKVEASIPLVDDRFGVTLGYALSEFDGAWENNHPQADNDDALTRGNLGGYENKSYSIGVNFEPTDRFKGSLNYLNNQSDRENPANYTLITSGLDSPADLLNCGTESSIGFATYCGELPTTVPLATINRDGSTPSRPAGIVSDPNAETEADSELLSFSLDYEVTDQVSLSYLYGRTEGSYVGGAAGQYDQTTGLGGFPAFLGFLNFLRGQNSLSAAGNGTLESDSHEFRVNFSPTESISAYVGGYLSDTTDLNISGQSSILTPAQADASLPFPSRPDYSTGGVLARQESEAKSVFGFISYDAGPISLSAEGRYTEEEVAGGEDKVELSYFTPRITAGYDISDSNSVYVSFAQGTKLGGINNEITAADVDQTERFFDEERNTTYEIGSRNEFMNGDLTFNLTGFYIEATDLQVNAAKTVADDFVGIAPAIVGNLGGSETIGFEVEANWDISENLDLYAAYGFADAEYEDGLIDQRIAVLQICDDIVCNANGDIGGNTLARAPKTTASAGFFFENDLTDDLGFFVGGDVGYQSKQYGSTWNTFTISPRTIVDASVGIRKDKFELKLSADNLLDNKYISNAFEIAFGGPDSTFGSRQITPHFGDRRLVKLNLSYDF